MLNAINTKILLAILAALTVIGGAVLYQRDQTAKAAAAATKAAAILQQQQDDADEQRDGTKSFGSRSRRTRSVTTPLPPMKARPGRRTSRRS